MTRANADRLSLAISRLTVIRNRGFSMPFSRVDMDQKVYEILQLLQHIQSEEQWAEPPAAQASTGSWQTKIERSDYELIKWGDTNMMIQDNRNRRSFPVPGYALRELLLIIEKQGQFKVSPDQIINHCIDTGVIPHPFEELV